MEKYIHADGNEKKAGVALLTGKMDSKTKTVIKDKEGNYLMIK